MHSLRAIFARQRRIRVLMEQAETEARIRRHNRTRAVFLAALRAGRIHFARGQDGGIVASWYGRNPHVRLYW